MLYVRIKNTTPLDKYLTHGDADCDYHVQVVMKDRVIWEGDIHHHDRMDGWPELLRKIAKAGDGIEPGKDQPLVKPRAYRNLLDGSPQDEAVDESAL